MIKEYPIINSIKCSLQDDVGFTVRTGREIEIYVTLPDPK